MEFIDLVDIFLDLIYLAIQALFAVTIAIIIYKIGSVWVIKGGEDPYARQTGRWVALTAVLVLAAMVSVWGLVRLVRDSFLW